MRGMALVIALGATACVRTETQTCEGGRLCPEGTTCHAVAATATVECVTPEQLEECAGDADATACTNGTCFSGACLPAGCGNERIDAGEVCDDGDLIAGNGCSIDCMSAETCGNGTLDPVRIVEGVTLPGEQCDDENLGGHDGCSSTCMAEVARWIRMVPFPDARGQHAMVSETEARRIVMFGGTANRSQGTVFSNETWELGRDGWIRLRTTLAPSPRSGHAMAYDGTRTLLFGGTTGTGVLGDTWELDGQTWRAVQGLGPKARRGHAMAFLPGTGIVLFGGHGSDDFDDTWVFANGVWTERMIAGPPAREGHVLVHDPVRGRLVLASGRTGMGYMEDTWEFDGTAWSPATTETPTLVDGVAAFDATRGQVLLHGGFGPLFLVPAFAATEQTRPETYAWTGTAWTRLSATGPERHSAAAATDPLTGAAVFHGGIFTDVTTGSCPIAGCDDARDGTFQWNGTEWAKLDHVALPNRSSMAVTYDYDRRKVVAYGGQGAGGEVSGTFELGDGDSWRRADDSEPTARSGAALAYAAFPTSRATVLFGGRNGMNTYAETFHWSGSRWTLQAPASSPPARADHGMAFDIARRRVVLFGGMETAPLADTWEYDGVTWTLRTTATQPSPRKDHAMAYDPVRGRVVVFGGSIGNTTAPLGDLWEYDGTDWMRIDRALAPPARAHAGMAWDAARRRIVLFGGDSSDTWEWDGDAWTFVPVFEPPTPRNDLALVSSPTGAGVLAVGGVLVDGAPDVLQFVHDSTSPYAACRSATLDDDGDELAGCADPDCWMTCTPACMPGTACDAAAPRCGDGTCDAARETCGMCPGDCGVCP